MFCPKCGVRNLEDAKFCRSCGADIRLVSQAMSAQLPEGATRPLEVEAEGKGVEKKGKRKSKEPPPLEKGVENVFKGIAFLIIFMLGLFYFSGAFMLWIWLIIPGLAGIGEGIGQIIRSRGARPTFTNADASQPNVINRASQPNELPAADTSEIIMPPSSVTEGTTRQLAVPAERASRDS
jgi:zinc ribbon protein